jgi:chemosensory pili system protein ChpA (sensor histidine kinase/response regulator)
VADTVSAQPLPADWSDTMTLPTLDAADLGAAMPELPEVSFELDLGAFGDAPAEAPTVVAAAAVDELPPFDLDAPPDDAALARDDLLSPVPAPDVDVIELDFDQPPADEADAPAPAAETVDEVDTDTAGDVKTADAETIEAEATFDDDEQVKVIGPLRIGIPLFNIYLNEADELSRRLGTELAEWSVEHHHRSVPDSAIALAHSLAGSSATVGYAELSTLARALEHALMRSRAGGSGRPGEAALFNDVADEIRRLLHQFAAGSLERTRRPTGRTRAAAGRARRPSRQPGRRSRRGRQPRRRRPAAGHRAGGHRRVNIRSHPPRHRPAAGAGRAIARGLVA